MAEAEKPDLTTLTVQLLSAYVSNNSVQSADLAGLIQSTRAALADEVVPAEPAQTDFTPATTARKSLSSRDHILSLIDGKPYKTLKRHLSTHGLTPAEYRERYKLPRDYPMVAAGYSEQRRAVAQRLGLGRKPTVPKTEAPVEIAPVPPEAPVEAGIVAPVKAPTKAPVVRKPRAKKTGPSPAALASIASPPPASTTKTPRKKLKIAVSTADTSTRAVRPTARKSSDAEASAPTSADKATAAPSVAKPRKAITAKARPTVPAPDAKPRRGRKAAALPARGAS